MVSIRREETLMNFATELSDSYAVWNEGDPERRLRWEMVSSEDGSVAGVGLEFLVIDAEGRIRSDYQFIES
jgi:hypothetical protein